MEECFVFLFHELYLPFFVGHAGELSMGYFAHLIVVFSNCV